MLDSRKRGIKYDWKEKIVGTGIDNHIVAVRSGLGRFSDFMDDLEFI